MRFEESDVAAIAAAEEVEIETRSAGGETHRTIIWIVERDGEVYVRSVRAGRGRWYREAVADPAVAIHVDGRRIAANALAATDPASVEACSEALRAKYRRDYSLASMLEPETLPTTMKLVPA
jgi:hypothetical protein